MYSRFILPSYKAREFNCPYCGVYASQNWTHPHESMQELRLSSVCVALSFCWQCNTISVWVANWEEEKRDYSGWRMIYPDQSLGPQPCEDMPDEIKKDFIEASKIVDDSPRGAAALLRICIQKLMPILGEDSGHLDTDIAELARKNRFPDDIIHSLDAVRVIGNRAVHPGEIDLFDDRKTAHSLFTLTNYIITQTLTERREIGAILRNLPVHKRDTSANDVAGQDTESDT